MTLLPWKIQHFADHLGSHCIEVIITDRSPRPLVVDFYSTLAAGGAPYQPYSGWGIVGSYTLNLSKIISNSPGLFFFSKRQCYRRWWDTIVFTFAYDGHILRMVAVTFSISTVTTELKAALGACAVHVIEENRPRSAPEKRASLCCRISPIEYIMPTKSFKMVKLLGWLVSPEAIDEINIEKC